MNNENGWIDCKHRMPEHGQFFLAYGKGLGSYIGGPDVDICRWDGWLWNEGGTEMVGTPESGLAFTHWIPLPDAPK